ncbi:hypothetical protein SAMN05216559_3765 [Halomicrobium zhouii]|uniref:Halobacterial output domain-containing protein n=1 Tax=Halomicrobium zhouii TaxID=767519 RepID=A0A1I6M4J8_9EURY|nr:HalOD1 output domain-containing protein [Halomicrobium zhouii]SFS10594.1 hypothetical protein SAMN05216559_3765 [Halomicrobium zhouii]
MTYPSTDGGEGVPAPASENPSNPPSTRVAYRLAEESDTAIEALRPLAESIDPEALDALFDGRAAENAYVTFRHEGFTITVTGNGDVLVDPVDVE